MGFMSGKSSLCTLFRDNFPGAKLSSYSQIVYSGHLTCETGEINHNMHFGNALFSFSAFSFISSLDQRLLCKGVL